MSSHNEHLTAAQPARAHNEGTRYAGALLVSVGAPLALGSWWGFLLTLIVVGVLSLRLSDEERYLREHLPGYADYMHAVRYRLVPFIW